MQSTAPGAIELLRLREIIASEWPASACRGGFDLNAQLEKYPDDE